MTTAAEAKKVLQAGDLIFTLWDSGDMFEMKFRDILINQLLSGPVEGSLNNLYLRLHRPEGIRAVPLLGIRSNGRLSFGTDAAVWRGEAEGIQYEVVLKLDSRGAWFWDVRLEGQTSFEIDVVYGQDIGIAEPGAVRSNEAYLSQYIDHVVFEHPRRGKIICSRQNQPQRGKFPYLQQGALTGTTGYSTDGFQFFGLSYKESDRPEALECKDLANEIYQYEFAYAALQTSRQLLEGQARFVFYGLVWEDHPEAVEALEFEELIEEAWRDKDAAAVTAAEAAAPVSPAVGLGEPLSTLPMEDAEIEACFPHRHHEEFEDGELLSFFTDTHEHVVLKEKELRVERPHGIILMSGENDRVGSEVLTTTSYMYGVFNSQIVVGNTSYHKLVSNVRNALNVSKASGQRIYVEMDGVYRLLTMPSMFEMGFNYARWTYKTAEDTILVTNHTASESPELSLNIVSAKGRAYRYLVTNQIVMNDLEFQRPYVMEQKESVLTFRADREALSASVYPDLAYRMHVTGTDFQVFDERRLAPGAAPGSSSLVVLETEPSSDWTLTVQGLLHGGVPQPAIREMHEETVRYRAFLGRVMNGFRLSLEEESTPASKELQKLNALAWWYTHNMLVHFSVPHGLEQYGGAAWGTRDVCQGPAEYFLATQKYGVVKDILKTVYTHQYEEDGNWPQWFMFDRYARIQQEESHGDIIVWPLKVLGDYLTATGDFGLLDEEVPYTKKGSFEPSAKPATIREHAKKEIDYIRGHFLHDTFLSSYGDGDWDDTLQPANAQLKRYMSSSWTVALTYQTFRQLAEALPEEERDWADELAGLAEGIQRDFNQFMLDTDVIPGFVYMEQPGQAERMLHPTDTKTGIRYRLLPMTRSMIAELLTAEQAEAHYGLIKEKLYYPDGVRLMDRPAKYRGGVSTHFKRAEQASNFGREIGLQYVHAHIRFIEAMAKLGKAEEAWNGLHKINPVGLKDAVPNAELRQSNVYFSSSDGKFSTRYEAEERFDELRGGDVPVKGGWRIYSSGPGIYLNQLISNCLGVRQQGEDLVLDPVLPPHLDGLRLDFAWRGTPTTFVYRMDGQGHRVRINGSEIPVRENPGFYRSGGVRISRQDFTAHGSNDHNVVEIFI
ncbi:GH36-type glycosyl hydrolase domain-containing protein [uncultured Paenibacillus sp.]|uniref:GH36-type glycosyl hydrolase domain-containing protein n=1 Tax=uncultured Paenibacillus sp. TaxID=227322 RepID=UPI0015B34FE3|nr:cellobiose phosphorylase [uncultured Paenibacillus sp.]